MNIQIYGKSKCFDTKKAERYFKERNIKFQSIDILKYGLSKGEYQSVKNAVGGMTALIEFILLMLLFAVAAAVYPFFIVG